MRRFLWPRNRRFSELLRLAILGAVALPAFRPAHDAAPTFALHQLPALLLDMARLGLGVYAVAILIHALWLISRPR